MTLRSKGRSLRPHLPGLFGRVEHPLVLDIACRPGSEDLPDLADPHAGEDEKEKNKNGRVDRQAGFLEPADRVLGEYGQRVEEDDQVTFLFYL
jgi:hypothetical protein